MTSLAINPKSSSTRPGEGLFSALLNRPPVLALLLAIATLVLYYPVSHYGFVNYDDADYVYTNRQVQSGLNWGTVRWAFTAPHAANWHPLTWISHALDCQIFGLNAGGPHDVNVLFHVLNAVLLFWVLLRATGFPGRSFMVAALFALHPINVESVAWISERKNVLSMMFFLLALGAYRWYASRPRVDRYLVVAILFALGLMAKPQVITLPCVLLLWDYWPLERMFRATKQDPGPLAAAATIPTRSPTWLMVEKLPLFLLTAAAALITMKVQQAARFYLQRRLRVGNGILSYGIYVKKAVWPADLALVYPHPGSFLSWSKVLVSGLVLLAITSLVIAGRKSRYLLVGWLWFVGTLIPVIGLVQVGIQSMADRYAYLSFIGLFIIVCWGTADLCERARLSPFLLHTTSVAVLLLLAFTARHQINYWRSNVSLWTHTLQLTTRNSVAESSLGSALAIDGMVQEAVPHFYKAIAIDPSDLDANMGIAIYDLLRGKYGEAIPHYKIVVDDKRAKQDIRVNAYIGMAKAYLALGERTKAQQCLDSAKRLGSSSARD